MSVPPENTLADPQQLELIYNVELAECEAERDEAPQRETGTAQVLQVIYCLCRPIRIVRHNDHIGEDQSDLQVAMNAALTGASLVYPCSSASRSAGRFQRRRSKAG